MRQKKLKKSRPFDLRTFLIGKLRAACRKWPTYNQVKTNAKVPVRVEYIERDGLKWLKASVIGTDEVVWVQVYKKHPSCERVMFRCAGCHRLFFDYGFLPKKKGGGLKKTPMTATDHIEPVHPLDGHEPSWSEIIARMFCDISNLQILCNYPGLLDNVKSCHCAKTAREKEILAAAKKALHSESK